MRFAKLLSVKLSSGLKFSGLQSALVAVGLVSSVVAVAPQAQANSLFTGFDFTPTVTGTNAQNSIFLNTATFGGTTVTASQFALVNDATIVQNAHLLGPASSDQGDLVTNAQCPATEMPTAANIVSSLGNLNLNCIVDTEDNVGTSVLDVMFDPNAAVNHLFFFERGMNSDIEVQGIDENGVYGTAFTIGRSLWKPAGYSINTTEVVNAQVVGDYGLKSNVRLKGLRLTSRVGFNGPDFKVVGAHVPEPMTVLGLAAVGGLAVVSRRRK
jgi:hypothetical protein